MKNYIFSIFNKVFSQNIFPKMWRIAIIIPIKKDGKDDLFPLNYRPISLTSCLCKLLEKMVNLRLMWLLERDQYITPIESSVRSKRSTTDSLVQFECDVKDAIKKGEHTIAVFFDLSKAYDTTWKHGVSTELLNLGLEGNLPKFINNFLSNRTIRVRVGNTLSEESHLHEGVPKGSVLSCTLFMIAMNSITACLQDGIKATLCVDDFTIYASGHLISSLERRLQNIIKKMEH